MARLGAGGWPDNAFNSCSCAHGPSAPPRPRRVHSLVSKATRTAGSARRADATDAGAPARRVYPTLRAPGSETRVGAAATVSAASADRANAPSLRKPARRVYATVSEPARSTFGSPNAAAASGCAVKAGSRGIHANFWRRNSCWNRHAPRRDHPSGSASHSGFVARVFDGELGTEATTQCPSAAPSIGRTRRVHACDPKSGEPAGSAHIGSAPRCGATRGRAHADAHSLGHNAFALLTPSHGSHRFRTHNGIASYTDRVFPQRAITLGIRLLPARGGAPAHAGAGDSVFGFDIGGAGPDLVRLASALIFLPFSNAPGSIHSSLRSSYYVASGYSGSEWQNQHY
jgi:hypothetical protein